MVTFAAFLVWCALVYVVVRGMAINKDTKQCTRCGQTGHHAHECPWPTMKGADHA